MARLAGYIRTSLDENCSNDQRQRDTIEQWAAKHGHIIVCWYCDRGGRRSDAEVPGKRQQFKRMMADLDKGLWELIAVEEPSRFGTKDHYQFDFYAYQLNEAGVGLYDAGSGQLMNPPPDEEGQVIQNVVRKMADRREDVTKSSRTISGKLAAAKLGRFQGGQLLCCSMLEARNAAGALLWTAEVVNGRIIQTYPDGRQVDRPGVPRDRNKGDYTRLVPSLDEAKRLCVKTIFEMFGGQNHGTPAIARRLNSMGTRTDGGKLWTPIQVRSVLRKGVHFAGRAAYGKVKAGKYHRRNGEGYDKVPAYGSRKHENVPHTEWLTTEMLDVAPVISHDLWLKCQARLAERKQSQREPKNGELYLAGLVVCGGCGKRMTGWSTKRDNGLRYRCMIHDRLGPGHCHANNCRQDQLEPLLGQYLERIGATLQGVREDDWLGQLFAERGQAMERLKSIRQAVERYLYDRLPEFLDFKQRGRFRHFEFEWPGDPWLYEGPCLEKFRLPEFDGSPSTLSYLLEWLSSVEHRDSSGRLAELEREHDRLAALFVGDLPDLLRQKLLRQITEAENELGRLRAIVSGGLAGELRAVSRQLVDLARRVSRARAAQAEEDRGARARALRLVLDSIVCEFETWRLARGKTEQRLARVRFVPLLGEEVSMDVPHRSGAIGSDGDRTVLWVDALTLSLPAMYKA